MGVFDELAVYCPACGQVEYLQSKAGECSMRTYNIENVPSEIAEDLVSAGDWKCQDCGKINKIVTQILVSVI